MGVCGAGVGQCADLPPTSHLVERHTVSETVCSVRSASGPGLRRRDPEQVRWFTTPTGNLAPGGHCEARINTEPHARRSVSPRGTCGDAGGQPGAVQSRGGSFGTATRWAVTASSTCCGKRWLVHEIHEEVHLTAVAVAETHPASPSGQALPRILRTGEPEPRQALGGSTTDRTRTRGPEQLGTPFTVVLVSPSLNVRVATRRFKIRNVGHRPAIPASDGG